MSVSAFVFSLFVRAFWNFLIGLKISYNKCYPIATERSRDSRAYHTEHVFVRLSRGDRCSHWTLVYGLLFLFVAMLVYHLPVISRNVGQNLNWRTILARSSENFRNKRNTMKSSPNVKWNVREKDVSTICNSSLPSWNSNQVEFVPGSLGKLKNSERNLSSGIFAFLLHWFLRLTGNCL